MKDTFKKILAGLLTVKSIVTILLAIIFAVLACTGVISGEQFLTIFTVIISFYFGTQFQKAENSTNKDNESEQK